MVKPLDPTAPARLLALPEGADGHRAGSVLAPWGQRRRSRTPGQDARPGGRPQARPHGRGGYGDLGHVTGFGTTLMSNGGAYASLMTGSGLAAVHDARRTSFERSVTEAHAHQARADGSAPVTTEDGVIVDRP